MHGKTIKPVKITADAIKALDNSNIFLLGVTAIIIAAMIVVVVLWKRDLDRKIKEIEENQ